MTSPSPEPRCRTCGHAKSEHGALTRYCFHREDGAALSCQCLAFVAPQEPATPRAEVTNAEWNPTASLPSGHMVTGGQFVPSRLDGEPRDPTLECGYASCKAVLGYRYSLSCCPNGRSHGPACTCGATFAAAVGDTETPPAPTPMVDALGMLGIDEAMTYQPPLNERYHCGCIRVAKWTRCEAHTTLAHDEEPPVAAPQETPEGEPSDESLMREFWFAVSEWEGLNRSNDKHPMAKLSAAYVRAESARAAVANRLATHTRSLAALREAATEVSHVAAVLTMGETEYRRQRFNQAMRALDDVLGALPEIAANG